MIIILLLILNHFIADYYFQTAKVSQEKRNNVFWLLIHVTSYLTIMSAFGMYTLVNNNIEIEMVFSWLVFNGILHGVTDFFTSKISYIYKINGKTKQMLLTKVVDQTIHCFCLLFSYKIMLSPQGELFY